MTTTGTDAPTSGDATAAPAGRAPLIAVRLFAGAAAEFGADTASVRAETLQELIDALAVGASAEAARVIDRSSFLVDAVACTDRGRDLAEGTRVDVLPPFAGG